MAQIPEKIQKKIALSAFTGKSAIRAIKIDHPNPSVEYVLSFVYYFVDHDNTRIQYIFSRINMSLFGLEFAVTGTLEKTTKEITKMIKDMGGKVNWWIHGKTAAVISNEEEIKKCGSQMKLAEKLGIQVVPLKFLDELSNTDPFEAIKSMDISPWNCKDVSFN